MTVSVALGATTLACITTVALAGLLRRIGGRGEAGLAAALLAVYGGLLVVRAEGWYLVDVVVVAASGAAGVLVARLVPSRPALVSFCVVAAIVDVMSFSGGFTAAIVEAHRSGTSDLLRYLAISAPSAGAVRPAVGIGDLIIVATAFSAMTRLGYSTLAAAGGPSLGLIVAVPVAFWSGGIWGIPFIAAGTLIALATSTTPAARA